VAVRVLRLEVPWVVLLVAALVLPLAAATVVMATITGESADTPTGMIRRPAAKTSKASSSNGEVTQRNSTDAALAILPALHGHEPAADEGVLAVVHEDPPDDPALAGLDPGRGGGHPVLSLAAHGAIPVHPKLARLGVHHGAIREQAAPGRAAGGRDPQVAPAPCASPVEPDHGHLHALGLS
jgi:hypothetical protein